MDPVEYIENLSGAEAFSVAICALLIPWTFVFLSELFFDFFASVWLFFQRQKCSDIHNKVCYDQTCHYKGCPHSSSCPYFVDNSFLPCFRLWLRKKRNKP